MTATSTIFSSQLSSSEKALSSAQYTGMMRSLADLAKAAYDLGHPDYSEYVNLNDYSAWSSEAWQAARNAGWQPLTFAALPAVSDQGAIRYGMTSDGFFINQNAAALVMRSDDAVVIAFRGTNDYSAKSGTSNPYDPYDTYHPDKDDWTTMNEHYALFAPLIRELDAWVAANNIGKVYVTGHSMGGAMALEYMSRHYGSKYEAVTFAATPFSQPYISFFGFEIGTERKDYYGDSRITQIEVSRDPAPMMFDVQNLLGDTNLRPGQLIRFGGNQTLDSPDQTVAALGLINYWGRTANHSMDYYRQIVDSVSAEAWDVIRYEPGTTTVLLGGRNQGNSQTFVVDGLQSGSGNIYDSGADSLANSNWEILFGGRGSDTLQGGNSASTLIGGAGNDLLISGVGSEQLRGGDGTDTLSYQLASRGVQVSLAISTTQITGHGTDLLLDIENLRGSAWSDRLSGNAQANHLLGDAGDDRLFGAEGSDTLDGGTGNDSLEGGGGDDLYVIDSSGDQIIESAAGGEDQVQSSISWTLPEEVEHLTLTGSGRIDAIGNSSANRLTGNTTSNSLYGQAGDDTLDGGAGMDTLIGGAGDDLYIVDNYYDWIFEGSSAGIDRVQSSVSFYLPDNVEHLQLTGYRTSGTGNALANYLQADAWGSTLYGRAGDDTLQGGTGADYLEGGAGNDLYIADAYDTLIESIEDPGIDSVISASSFTLGAGLENLQLTSSGSVGTGNELANLLQAGAGNHSLLGGAGDDTLVGGSGADTLLGGSGNDLYLVDDTADLVIEIRRKDGIDRIDSSIDLILGKHIEHLQLSGSADLQGCGNRLANQIIGNTGDNLLSGLKGKDTLIGGLGQDTLSGGGGRDRFVYTSTGESRADGSHDIILDFRRADRIDLSLMDADDTSSGQQHFTILLGATGSFTAAGQLRFAAGMLYGNTDADSDAEFAIELIGLSKLSMSNLIV